MGIVRPGGRHALTARPGCRSSVFNWGTPGTRGASRACPVPDARAPDPFLREWTGVPGRAVLMHMKENTSDAEAALGPSRCLTGTVVRRDPAYLNGRRRGTKNFLGRGERSSQSQGPRQKAPVADPVDVFGAASRGHCFTDKTSTRRKSSALSILPGYHAKEESILQNYVVRALDNAGHRWVKRNYAIRRFE